MANETGLGVNPTTGIQLLGEYLVPGGANLVNGDFQQAGIHAVLGIAARAAFGVPGFLLVSANSIAKASTGHNLWEILGLNRSSAAEAEAAPATDAKKK